MQFNSLLPKNRTSLELALEKVTAGKYCKERLDVDVIKNLHNPDLCPVELLPWLAYSVAVSIWDDKWDETKKRRVIAAAIDIHRRKGTLGAVKRMLEAIGVDNAEIIEWFNESGLEHGRFFVKIPANDAVIDTPEKQAGIAEAINSVKRLSAHYALFSSLSTQANSETQINALLNFSDLTVFEQKASVAARQDFSSDVFAQLTGQENQIFLPVIEQAQTSAFLNSVATVELPELVVNILTYHAEATQPVLIEIAAQLSLPTATDLFANLYLPSDTVTKASQQIDMQLTEQTATSAFFNAHGDDNTLFFNAKSKTEVSVFLGGFAIKPLPDLIVNFLATQLDTVKVDAVSSIAASLLLINRAEYRNVLFFNVEQKQKTEVGVFLGGFTPKPLPELATHFLTAQSTMTETLALAVETQSTASVLIKAVDNRNVIMASSLPQSDAAIFFNIYNRMSN